MKIKLLEHQQKVLDELKDKNKVAMYLDMGLGKTFTGSEKLKQLNAEHNLIVCQKSKIDDWYEHFNTYYPEYTTKVYKTPEDLENNIIIINYNLVWRREELLNLKNFTLLLDESSCIKNESAKRTKFILKLNPTNVILLSGTPTGGKYEELYSQCKLLGWKISKRAFWDAYVITENIDMGGFKLPMVIGYKNVERLKKKLRQHGAVFMKTEEVLTLPEQVDNIIKCDVTKEYKTFAKNRIVKINGIELVGDTTLTKMLYQRQLASQYNSNKTTKLRDLLESTNDRVIIFYNFNDELEKIKTMCEKMERPISIVNGEYKDLKAYNEEPTSITCIQYQAGAMGLNLQKSNKIIYFSLPLSSELFEQSKKRTHRMGQDRTCFYYYLLTKESIDNKIFSTLKQRKNFTNKLFEELDPDKEVIKTESKITPAKLIPKDKTGIITYISDELYYGINNFIIRETLCESNLKKRIKDLHVQEVAKDTFKHLFKEQPYKVEKVIENNETYITLKSNANEVNISKTYYNYFKDLGLTFKFTDRTSPIGLYKNDECVGIVMPIVIKSDDVCVIDDDDIPF